MSRSEMLGNRHRASTGCLLALWLVAPLLAVASEPAPSFTRDIKGILSNRCVRCHGPDPEGRAGGGAHGLRLDTFAGATEDLGGHAALVPGSPDQSEIIRRIVSTDPDVVMPPPEAGERLSEAQVALLRRWIAAGGAYEPHWAYVRPTRPTVPAVKNTAWAKNEIDRFILARLEAEGLAPQPEADRATLARRLALDLTGLPLSPEEIDAFVADGSPDAVERLVDRLLLHEGYGEHMARQWLDLARYADSAGYGGDAARTIWGWRDWVVKAFDANMPFDQFTIRQLAGDKRRTTRIQLRGNWQNLGEAVVEGVPAAFNAVAVADGGRVDRLALARWLVDPANPLTARVVVNRLWERFFGIGLVSTSEEFGSQGELPSHPELLDWLAVELVARHWDLRAIQRLIVTSAAYRQTSKCPPEVVARDPENRLVACGPRVRLSAEVIRDQALAAAGLLSRKKGGPSVNLPQPDSSGDAVPGGGAASQASTVEDRYRRALYITWRRSNPYPSMTTFDAPSREVCTVRRPRTNTPLQALVTMNDPAYVEPAQALARRMVREAGPETADRAQRGFRLVLARQPSSTELDRIVRLHDDAFARFQRVPEDARKMATDPLGPVPPDLPIDVADLAAWTVVANVLLNLDETFMCP